MRREQIWESLREELERRGDPALLEDFEGLRAIAEDLQQAAASGSESSLQASSSSVNPNAAAIFAAVDSVGSDVPR